MRTDIRFKLSKRIRELRKKAGITQERLSELSGIDYKHIQQLEGKDPSASTIRTLEKLAKAFKMTVSELTNF